jgi:hypothetical protein
MRIHSSITQDRIIEACEADDCLGFCTACGADAYGVEPDARRYECEARGASAFAWHGLMPSGVAESRFRV